MISEKQLQFLKENSKSLPDNVRKQVAELLSERAVIQTQSLGKDDFLVFAQQMWPDTFVFGKHHKIIAQAFNRIASGESKRLIVALPPRHSKSEMASYLLPAWYLGRNPNKKVIQASNTAELAVGFGRRVRNLIDSERYQAIFSDVALSKDSTAAGRWGTSHQGEYFAIGVGGTMTGRGADLLIVDDPHTESEAALAAANPEIYDKVYEWYTSGPRQRLQPGGAIVILATRWSKRDLSGQVLKAAEQRGGDQWEVVSFPALDEKDEPTWPEFWPKNELINIRSELPASKWLAQYQQTPTSEEGAIIKRDWWRVWDLYDPPECEYIIQSWDTAFLKTERADYSACTTWGIFQHPDDKGVNKPHIILLNAFKKRMEFPELKEVAYREYIQWEPDSLIVEAKAAGQPLIHELRARGIPVQEFVPSRGNDKISRLNAVSDVFASGMVWAPPTFWADEVIEETASFPNGEHDDLVDSLSCAILRYRKGGFIGIPTDYEDDEPISQRKPVYY